MKEIDLGKGYKAKVDDEDYDWLMENYSFHFNSMGYARTTKIINGDKTSLAMHRIILERYEPIPEGLETDHIDGDKLNNQRSNLRLVTHQINCQNRRVRRNPICPKCGIRKKYKSGSYCLPCHLEYMKERRKNPEIRKKETEYKRAYRQRLKDGTVLRRDE